MKMKNEKWNRVVINVSGEMFETHERTLERFPETLLGDQGKRHKYFCWKSKQYFFDRHRQSFDAILYFYQSYGNLSRPNNISFEDFEKECAFFQIPKASMEFLKLKEGIPLENDEEMHPHENQCNSESEENPSRESTQTLREKVWNLLENPETSSTARSLAIFSLFTIFISVTLACLETIPDMSKYKHSYVFKDPFFMLELVLNSYFLIELIARIIACPDLKEFFKGTLNVIDVIAVVPYFIILCVDITKLRSLAFLRILRFLRVLRLFRLSKHSARIKIVGAILAESLQDLRLFFVCLMIIAVFSGSLMYFIENTAENSPFTSIPESMWWALQTVVTLGYGDITPVTIAGKCYSAIFMVFGAVTISLPVLSIVMKFTTMYK
eukprot:TCONS_00026947-protein